MELMLANYVDKIPELKETFIFHDIKSTKGQEILIEKFKNYLLNQYIDSLKPFSLNRNTESNAL